MIQVCDPPRQRQVRRLSAEIFYIGALRRGGVLPSPLRGAADADRRRGVGHSRGSAAGATPYRRYRRRSGTAQLAGTSAAGGRLPAHPAGKYRRGAARPAGGNCRSPGRPAAPQGHGMGGGRVHRNGGSAVAAVFSAGLRAAGAAPAGKPCALLLLCTGCAPVRTAPVWVPLEDRVQLALLLAKGYAALDSRPYGGSLALALYPLKETE